MVSVRLRRIKQEYGDRVVIKWKSFPLYPDYSPGRRVKDLPLLSATSRMRAAAEEEGIGYKDWPKDVDMPASSIPGLEAAKCAELQGEEAFERFHFALLRAYFVENHDISQRDVMVSVARQAGLDVERFISDYDGGAQRAVVLAEYQEALKDRQFSGIPAAFFDSRIWFEGGVPIEMYRRAIDRILAES